MPPVKLTDIKDIANIVKSNYAECLNVMHFYFCYKIGPTKYFIFQEIQGMPIQRLVYHESNNSVSFVAAWAAWGNPYALVADANNQKIKVWRDLLDRSRPYNYQTNKVGNFTINEWTTTYRKSKYEQKRKLKTRTDTFVEFRVENIERAVFNESNFQLFSPTLSLLACMSKQYFPYTMDGEVDEDFEDQLVAATQPVLDDSSEPIEMNSPILRLSFSGKSFDVSCVSGVEPPVLGMGSTSYTSSVSDGKISYWDKNECDPENELFDEEVAEILLNERKISEVIFDVGQRRPDLLL